jgi:hypothetical protein
VKPNRILLPFLFTFAACSDEDPPSSLAATSKELGPISAPASIKARDGGYSGSWGGKSFWFFGDSILAFAGEDGSSWRNNTSSWTADLEASDGIAGFEQREDSMGAPHEAIPRTEDERDFNDAHAGDPCRVEPCGARYAVWAGPIVADPDPAGEGRALLFYTEIYGEPGEWNFRGIGQGIAVWRSPDSSVERPIMNEGWEHPTLMFEEGEPSFGTAALAVDRDLYIYACDGGLSKPCLLARVPSSSALDRSAWRYFAGDGRWSERLDEATAVFDGAPMMSVHWSDYLGAYVAVYSKIFDKEVVMRTAPRPEGPWSGELHLFNAMNQSDGDPPYAALAHAEYAKEGGRIEYVTYYRSTGDWSGEIRLVEVTLSKDDLTHVLSQK